MRNIPCRSVSLVLVWIVAAAGSGCGSIRHVPITAKNEATDRGIRYYGSSPYLIVHSNEKGGLVADIKYLPDPNKKMSVRPRAFASSVEATLHFDKGVLTKSDTSLDATVVPMTILKAAETIAPALITILEEEQDKPGRSFYEVPAPHVYKIIVRGRTIHFVGGPGDTGFSVTLLPQEEK